MDSNFNKQSDEMEAMSSIYGEDFHHDQTGTCNIDISVGAKSCQLQLTMPADYPSFSPPSYTLNAPWLKGEKREALYSHLNNVYLDNIGESIIYLWVEKVRSFMEEDGDDSLADKLQKQVEKQLSALDMEKTVANKSNSPEIITGEIISDRKSHFQPHLAVVKSESDVRSVLRSLYENKKIASATHNMYAYRFLLPNGSTVAQDCEDDGEAHAGGRLLHLLEILDAKDVIVIVTRWFGGIHLGPDRFKHISNAARQVLSSCGYVATQSNEKRKKGKKKK